MQKIDVFREKMWTSRQNVCTVNFLIFFFSLRIIVFVFHEVWILYFIEYFLFEINNIINPMLNVHLFRVWRLHNQQNFYNDIFSSVICMNYVYVIIYFSKLKHIINFRIIKIASFQEIRRWSDTKPYFYLYSNRNYICIGKIPVLLSVQFLSIVLMVVWVFSEHGSLNQLLFFLFYKCESP